LKKFIKELRPAPGYALSDHLEKTNDLEVLNVEQEIGVTYFNGREYDVALLQFLWILFWESEE
jgi:hypothetical protein